jgi:hypothetical protein
MSESTTVTVGLDVHTRSIRLAAVRTDELLAERTLPYDEESVELRPQPSGSDSVTPSMRTKARRTC